VASFSSGSVLAQRLLFRHSTAGDLSGFIHAYFDTATGPKAESTS
jgi:enolase-phosphatase E1